ncbi:glycosyltransferase family 2 protein [Flavobacterium ponti]|uniref:Glycosyltransferase family 2 protein n=2 Tax=Flavobacterium ponti TaxID=665133 RepID=A0ABV9P648_9FLAO
MISIIIPTYNQVEYIVSTLESVSKQSYEKWECLIIDDGSNDNTEEVIHQIIKNDSRFKYFKKSNGGASSARNYGINIAKGEYIQFLDSDDCLHEDKLIKSIDAFKENKTSDIIISNFNMFNDSIYNLLPPYCSLENKVFDFNSILLDWDVTYTIPLHCAMFKKTLFKEVRFDESIQSKEDWIMWVTIFQNGARATFLNQSLAFYRYNNNGNHTNDDDNFIKANMIVYKLITEESKIKLFEKNLKDLKDKLAVLKKCQSDYEYLDSENHNLHEKLKTSTVKKVYKKLKNFFK